jgi:DNA invertase Pin-like site-specific DNA recombinase
MISISDKVKSAFEEQERNQEKVRKQNGWDEVASRGLPSHVGYKQLAIILEKRGQFDEAIKVAKQAKSQGWNGDWDKRIARCESKLDRKRAAF